jgi:hypothetical protein
VSSSNRPRAHVAGSFGQRFWPVFGAGLVGVLSLPLMFPPALDAQLRAAFPTVPMSLLKMLALIQPALLLAAGCAIGAALAHRLGLSSHLAGINLRRRFVTELPLAIALGLASGASIVAADRFVFRAATDAPATDTPRAIGEGLIGGLLYGGLTEEAMMRFGLLSLVAWALLRLARRPLDAHAPFLYVIAIVVAAIMFGAGHLPAAATVAPLDAALVTRILLLNGVAGIVYGALFWRRSLESAMVAHMSTHVAFAIARVMQWT